MVVRKTDRQQPNSELERIASLSIDELEKEVNGEG